MIVLAPGTLKYLLIDHLEVKRNAERRARSAPTAVVVEKHPEGVRHYIGHSIRVEGEVGFYASPLVPLVTVRLQPHYEDEKVYAAFCTSDEVRIAETDGEVLTGEAPATTAAPTAPKTTPSKAKPTIKKEVPKPDGEGQ